MRRYQILALHCGKTTPAICLVFVRLNTLLKSHENFHSLQTLNPLMSIEKEMSFWGVALIWTATFKIYEAEGSDGNGNMTSLCQLCKHLVVMGIKCSSAWRLFEELVYKFSPSSQQHAMVHLMALSCSITSSPHALLIYPHIYLFLLNNVLKVVDWIITALPTVTRADLCPSFPQGGQCCLPVRPGNCGAGGVRAGAKAGRGDFPCRRPLWLAGRVSSCAQTPQPTYFCNCKLPFTYSALYLGGFHHSCLQKILVSNDTCRDCLCWGQEHSDPMDFASEKTL